jgi:hypothetical protein
MPLSFARAHARIHARTHILLTVCVVLRRRLLLRLLHHQFFDSLRVDLLLGGKSQEKEEDEKEKEEEENLSLEQFLYFVGLALDLDDMDEYERGYSPLEALISRQRNHGERD